MRRFNLDATWAPTACAVILTTAIGLASQQPQGRGGPPAPTGPMAPEKYKNIQVLTDVPADQLDVTMRYIVAATGIQCGSCHVQDAATGEWQYDKDDKNAKKTARKMMTMVKAIAANSADYGLNGVNCGTCHAGNNSPRGLQPAQMMTPDQVAAMLAQQAQAAARQGGSGAPPAGAPGGAGGRGAQTPARPIDDVLAKYIDALGGKAAVDKLQAVTITGTVLNRASQSMPFTIDEKGAKYREAVDAPGGAVVRAFDGTAGWSATGTRVVALDGFPAQQIARDNILTLATTMKERYPNMTARAGQLAPAPGAAPIPVVTVSSGPAVNYTTETFVFDDSTGLLLRKTVRTATGLRGSLNEQWDYGDYRVVNGVKMPFEIKHTNWNTLDTYKVTD